MDKKQTEKVKSSFITDKLLPTLSSVGSLLFIVLGTILIIYYIQGYRLTLDGKVEKTGVLMVTTNPPLTNVILNGQDIGRAPKTVTSLKVGTHKIEIKRNGYFDWKKDVKISEGRTTPINALLFKNNVKGKAELKINEKIFFSQSDSQNKNIFIATELTVGENKAIKILKYSTNQQFWQNNNNPIVIFDELISSKMIPTIKLSPQGKTLLMSFDGKLIDRETGDLTEDELYGRYLYVTTNQSSPNPKILDRELHDKRMPLFINENELMLIGDTTIEKLDLRTEETVMVTDQLTMDLVWDIDQDGLFYYLEEVEVVEEASDEDTNIDSQEEAKQDSESRPSKFRIMQIAELGDEPKVIIEEAELIYYDEAKENKDGFDYEVIKFVVANDSKNIVVTASEKTIFVDIETSKFIDVADEYMYLETISPDKEKALFYNKTKIALLIFDKESADHVTQIGSVIFNKPPKDYVLEGMIKPLLLTWHTSSEVFLIADGNSIYVSDLDGQNLNKLVLCTNFCTASENGDSVYVLDRELSGATTSLIRYNIR